MEEHNVYADTFSIANIQKKILMIKLFVSGKSTSCLRDTARNSCPNYKRLTSDLVSARYIYSVDRDNDIFKC